MVYISNRRGVGVASIIEVRNIEGRIPEIKFLEYFEDVLDIYAVLLSTKYLFSPGDWHPIIMLNTVIFHVLFMTIELVPLQVGSDSLPTGLRRGPREKYRPHLQVCFNFGKMLHSFKRSRARTTSSMQNM